MERFRSYLLLLARIKLDRKARGKVDASDIVQQTLLEAHQAMESFRGGDTAAQAAWLRQILARNLVNAVRDLTRAKRDVRKERALKTDLDASAAQLDGWPAAEQSSPSQKMQRQEPRRWHSFQKASATRSSCGISRSFRSRTSPHNSTALPRQSPAYCSAASRTSVSPCRNGTHHE